MKDIIPPQGDLWLRMTQTAIDIATAYDFHYFETPVVEATSLFVRSLGRGTDVIDKEMYAFEDRDGGKICLRPEMTASVARSYIMQGMQTLSQPVKLWNIGPLFRYDRPQAGRYREFHQFDCETIGESAPVIDAELIAVAYNYLRDLGLTVTVRINSLGTPTDRANYLVELTGFLRGKRGYLCDDCKKRLLKNPLRVLDCKVDGCSAVVAEAPQIVDWLSETSKTFFMSVLEYLDELAIPYVLTPTLVRGLDYYTHTVFELFEDKHNETAQSALGGGGRYDLLIEQLGGQPTPASGFAIGMERVMHAVQALPNLEPQKISSKPIIFFAHLGEQARRRVLKTIEELRQNGIVVRHNLAKSSLKAQLELANKYNATHTLILGQKEVQDGTVLVRNMESGIQEIVDQNKIRQTIVKILAS
ncbi:MAG: histidine--tRNA ligase [Candidatus Magasanikbacteria bacterium RIFCSPHIGHO2_01_FULL_41_23]|uniref:Histidine--tRNA ligase n=1 Tax=Candidatus Magasanikbacteria bacterium RIFCSPLOWO2_01_FULL_40_15 TaxID=1798686 RepID=A0A1F6N520_9BACT|nr:MAG: histidine--tRNA ligase [Candidatus Magasanikbacteria bacterium RIFCSPHIGHO2_01_FULL_41_23]OGH67218.1 MAG: histidine--tRNA ligase [Candidatus Magasanikbacteria bacterium RIFCSPHIGHO2_02_FULL_41_35]OGH76744.1 MAG: histidine--tRNA ligase [Candidatus Magasanikbacteria bacterium RIFCSPHIGHO2_12_FULL_41_16]OGH78753.1 MAG: histidine--tRNA ligase [Candidatus Magasanikbacteria bacterium RIFCSPLOWO2_01_FULL_40_15]